MKSIKNIQPNANSLKLLKSSLNSFKAQYGTTEIGNTIYNAIISEYISDDPQVLVMSCWDNLKATFRNIATTIARLYLGISEDEIIRNWQAYHHQAHLVLKNYEDELKSSNIYDLDQLLAFIDKKLEGMIKGIEVSISIHGKVELITATSGKMLYDKIAESTGIREFELYLKDILIPNNDSPLINLNNSDHQKLELDFIPVFPKSLFQQEYPNLSIKENHDEGIVIYNPCLQKVIDKENNQYIYFLYNTKTKKFHKVFSYQILNECLDKKNINLGRGFYGKVHERSNNSTIAVKNNLTTLNDPVNRYSVKRYITERNQLFLEVEDDPQLSCHFCPGIVSKAKGNKNLYKQLARKIDGYSLEDIISNSCPRYILPKQEILLEKFQNLEYALLKLLEKGWVHRDLNLGNIMFDNNTQEFIVIDFDLYRRFDATKNHSHLNQFVEEIKRIVAITQKQVLSIY